MSQENKCQNYQRPESNLLESVNYLKEHYNLPSPAPSHPPQHTQVANFSIEKGFHYVDQGNPGRAFAHLIVALQLVPEWREGLKFVFLKCLSDGCRALESEGKIDSVIDIKKQALKVYPQSEEILCDLATHYIQLSDYRQAETYYENALSIRPDFLPAFHGLQSVKNAVVERWHFRMLNDKVRNKSYRSAIANKIKEGFDCVLDIGSGTGILSLFSLAEGATEIYAVEGSQTMYEKAVAVLELNNSSSKVVLINDMSTNLCVPNDIPKRVSLVVTETFDSGLFGEGILHTLKHAWESLLLPPCSENNCQHDDKKKERHGSVIPFSATVWVAAIQCLDVSRRFRLLPDFCVCGMAGKDKIFSQTNNSEFYKQKQDMIFGNENLCRFCKGYVNDTIFCCNIRMPDNLDVATKMEDPYDTEDIALNPNNYQLLSVPHKAIEVNFNSLNDIESCLNNKGEKIFITASESGFIDAVMMWFHLNLDNKGNILSTAPMPEEGVYQASCWHPAIFPLQRLKFILPGEQFAINVACDLGKLDIKFLDERKEEPKRPLKLISSTMISFLNDRSWLQHLYETAVILAPRLNLIQTEKKRILDMNPFPFLGMALLKLLSCDKSWKILFSSLSAEDEDFVKHVALENGIPVDQLEILTECNSVADKNFDVITVPLIQNNGELNEKIIYSMPDLRNNLSFNGVMIPYMVVIEGQIIESDWIIENSSVVSDDNVGGFKIAQIVNESVVNYHVDIKASAMPHKPLTEVFELLKLGTENEDSISVCSAFSQELSVEVNDNGCATGLLYWAKIATRPGIEPLSTSRPDSHCHQAAILLNKNVSKGIALKLKIQYYHGLLNVTVL